MQQKKFTIILAAAFILIFGTVGYFIFSQKLNPAIQSLSDTVTLSEVQHEDLNKFGDEKSLACIGEPTTLNREEEFVVNNDADYQRLLEYKSSSSQCASFILPQIDFSQKTLLGRYASGSGCSVDFIRTINKDDSRKKIVYAINVKKDGLCEKLGFSMNWILIPKIPSNYTVEFQIK